MAMPNDSEFEELEKWLYENYFTPFEDIDDEELKTNVFRINQESDSIFSNIGGNEMGFTFLSMLFGDEMKNVAHKRQQQQVFDEMMKESTSIRRQTVNANRSSGWGRDLQTRERYICQHQRVAIDVVEIPRIWSDVRGQS